MAIGSVADFHTLATTILEMWSAEYAPFFEECLEVYGHLDLGNQ